MASAERISEILGAFTSYDLQHRYGWLRTDICRRMQRRAQRGLVICHNNVEVINARDHHTYQTVFTIPGSTCLDWDAVDAALKPNLYRSVRGTGMEIRNLPLISQEASLWEYVNFWGGIGKSGAAYRLRSLCAFGLLKAIGSRNQRKYIPVMKQGKSK
jgi:hypothetical protein